MDKRSFITVSILISALAFNPLLATELNTTLTNNTQRQIVSVSNNIASVLHKRGLDEEVAEALSAKLIEDDTLFEAMLNNLMDHYGDISREDVFEELATMALHRQEIDLSVYDHLVSLLSKVKKESLSEQNLQQLKIVSKLNEMVYV